MRTSSIQLCHTAGRFFSQAGGEEFKMIRNLKYRLKETTFVRSFQLP